jgi:VanZ family protein
MSSLRLAWLWWGLGCLLVTGVVVGSLMPASGLPPVPVRDKLLHVGTYFLLMLWFSGLVERRRYGLLALLLFGLGLGLDLVQATTATRRFEAADVAAKAGGILLALLLAWFVVEGWCRRVEQWLLTK